MKAIITIDLDNDAFQPYKSKEVVRILRRLADDIKTKGICAAPTKLMDINGNSVGRFDLEMS